MKVTKQSNGDHKASATVDGKTMTATAATEAQARQALAQKKNKRKKPYNK